MKKLDTPKKDLQKPESKTEPKGIGFKLTSVDAKPSKTYNKGSKYDGILEAFTEGKNPLVRVELSGVKHNYLQIQLKKRLVEKGIQNIKVSTSNAQVYLEKVEPGPE